ncbi:MAG: SRPBCC family protein [bacterium]
MNSERFVYAIYIASDPKTVWKALLDGEFTRKYWEHDNVSDWKAGSPWEHRRIDSAGTVDMTGRVVESDPPRRLVMTWALPKDKDKKEAHSRVTIEIEPIDEMVRLTVTHDQLEPGSDMLKGISSGWPRVLSSLKSLLETGKPLRTWAKK